jgi:hypothetical protein
MTVRGLACVAAASVALGAALGASAAAAAVTFPSEGTPFRVERQDSGDTHAGIGGQAVRISGTNVRHGSARVSAGGFALTSEDVGDFLAWCLDTAKLLQLASDYAVTATPFESDPELTAGQKADIKRLFDTAYDDLLGAAPDGGASAAFQLALWEIVNETKTDTDGAPVYNVSDGYFYATSNTGARNDANALLGDLDESASGNYRLIFLESQTHPASQNLVTVAAVPLPAAGVMLFGALGGAAALWRRRRPA